MSLKDMFAKQNKRKAEDEAKGIIKKPKVRLLFQILSSCCHIQKSLLVLSLWSETINIFFNSGQIAFNSPFLKFLILASSQETMQDM